MKEQLIECVPNFSEGKDLSVIKQITDEIEAIEGVSLLDVDPGADTNRTVVTFVGNPKAVVEAAFQAIKKAAELIDMRKHSGAHPRMGATDVCPMVPIANITMEETVEYAKKLGARVGEKLKIPVYLYEYAASKPSRENLSIIREGEYEAFADKISKAKWKPDYGEAKFNARAGVTAIGARDFLIAYNINLNTRSVRRANAVAFDIREQGRVKRRGGKPTGAIVKNKKGEPVRIPGSLKAVKGIGWYIEEYGIAQISVNLTNINITPLHVAFDEACKKATKRGLRVTGSELVGLVPLKSMLDAGRYFLKKQRLSQGVSEQELIHIAVKSMGLDEIRSFEADKKIIEYMIRDKSGDQLANMSLREFANETATDSPAPGGGSIAAYLGALGTSLGTMVANLSAHKKGWETRYTVFSKWAEKGQRLKDQLLAMVDEDTAAFNRIMDAFRLPKGSAQEKKQRETAIQSATKYAIEVPFKVMELSLESMKLMEAMVDKGNPNSVSDAGVGALCARSAVLGGYLNVTINMQSLKDEDFKNEVLEEATAVAEQAEELEAKILDKVFDKISEL